ncbi:MAG: hypothetical protein VKI83_09605 [Synechococcaceae cyanobacterium]|nr:hypothetical protein [Synechococcaceae cyanobacterium]
MTESGQQDATKSAATKLILCIKWGSKYDAEYVNRLNRMCGRHISPPYRLVCFTDNPAAIDADIQVLPLPELGCDPPQGTPGQWRKLGLWGAELHGLQGPALFIDLDSLIVDDLDPYFSYGEADDVILEHNWARPLSGLGQTSVFRFRIGSHPEILERFRSNPQAIGERFRYEQHFVTDCLGPALRFWPSGWTRHFRLHCLGPDPLRFVRPARLPRGSRIITFPGGPNPSEAREGRWRPNSPAYAGRRAHLQRVIGSGEWKLLRKFLMPVPWIDEHWH